MQGLAGLSPGLIGQRWPALRSFPVLFVACVLHVLLHLVRLSAPQLRPSRESRCSARCLECRKQGLTLPGTAIQGSIDEERGSALYSAAFTPFHILLDAGERALVGQSACVLLHIETNRFCKLLQVGILKRMLVVEDVIMHLPKLTLHC